MLDMVDFVSSGILELDKLLGGGMIRGRNYLLEVESGVKELTFVLSFLREGLRQRELCGIVSHDLPSAEIIRRFSDIGFDVKRELDSGSFIITDLCAEGRYDPERRGPILVTDNPTDTTSAFRLFADMGAIATRKIREGFKGIRSAYISMSSEIMVYKFEQVYKLTKKAMPLVAELSGLSLVVFHPKMFDETIVSAIEQLFDGVIMLSIGHVSRRFFRLVRVKKSPAGSFDMDEHKYEITMSSPLISL